ncbi:hypothetical protein LEJE111609_21220 [Lelliottia jeotgali]
MNIFHFLSCANDSKNTGFLICASPVQLNSNSYITSSISRKLRRNVVIFS